MHLLGEPVDLPPGVAEDDGLGDGDGLVQIAERVQLPLLLLDGDVELLDTFKGQLVPLDQDPDGFTHELLRDLQYVGGHGGREKHDLSVLRQKLEDLVDLVLETARQHLIGLIETEDLDGVGPESATVDHVEDTAGRADDDLDALLELSHVLTDVGTTNAGVAFDVHVVTEGDDDFLDLLGELTGGGENERLSALDVRVELLEDGNGEGRGLAGTGLGLGDDIVTFHDGDDGALLDGRGALETFG